MTMAYASKILNDCQFDSESPPLR